jgi:hypothetical protein
VRPRAHASLPVAQRSGENPFHTWRACRSAQAARECAAKRAGVSLTALTPGTPAAPRVRHLAHGLRAPLASDAGSRARAVACALEQRARR